MTNSDDEIFLLKGNEIVPLPSKTMRAGLFGKSLEEALQQFIERFPKVIPSKQIDPDDPPRFVLLRREMPVGGWSLDHLFVDQKGILTLVETKLFQNPESRREVIGQIIEYAANAYTFWGNGLAKEKAIEYWTKHGKELDDVLLNEFNEEIMEDFWDKVEENLKDRRIRLMIATDELRPEVSRMIEYLNAEMKNTELLGLEIKFYGSEDGSLVMVPRIYGVSERKKESGSGTKGTISSWTIDKLKEFLAEIPDDILSQRLNRILTWAVEKKCFQLANAIRPIFGIRGKNNLRIISINYGGQVYLFVSQKHYLDGEPQRDAFLNDLKAIGLVENDFYPSTEMSGRNLNIRLQELSDDDFDKFISILEKYL